MINDHSMFLQKVLKQTQLYFTLDKVFYLSVEKYAPEANTKAFSFWNVLIKFYDEIRDKFHILKHSSKFVLS